ncbi:response regulator transcription factor [Streptomyces sp. WAC01280]|uniref:response regulator transcription factor n=1 Tax=Streptomyces sp. WAC01280 TaxID=2487424 RepID=UPI00163C7FE8|nr:helix-turn-helix transcriptional regulator [Streptomyces sp. WAC01280]
MSGGLTERQLDILRLAANGHTDQAIAHQLGISLHTVRDQWRWGIKPRLGAIDRTNAVALAFAAGHLTAADLLARQEHAA